MSSQHPKTGEKFLATVKLVRPEGIYFEKRGNWSGCIAASFFGKGATREAALAKVHPGDTCKVEILAVHPGNRSLEFTLAKSGKMSEPTSRKPAFAPCARRERSSSLISRISSARSRGSAVRTGSKPLRSH